MKTATITMALAATFIAIASPVFASDDRGDPDGVGENSGRFTGTMALPSPGFPSVIEHRNAAVRTPFVIERRNSAVRAIVTQPYDFQLDGR